MWTSGGEGGGTHTYAGRKDKGVETSFTYWEDLFRLDKLTQDPEYGGDRLYCTGYLTRKREETEVRERKSFMCMSLEISCQVRTKMKEKKLIEGFVDIGRKMKLVRNFLVRSPEINGYT